MNIKDFVYKKIRSLTKKDFNQESNVYEIGVDSLDFIELITNVEEELNISISDDELMSIKKVEDIIKLLESKK